LISATQATNRLEEVRSDLGIPAQAKLVFVEKRIIELERASGGVEAAIGADPVYANQLAWIGKFTLRISFWEVAVDERGSVIRLGKSR
jgi:hypothetical protein